MDLRRMKNPSAEDEKRCAALAAKIDSDIKEAIDSYLQDKSIGSGGENAVMVDLGYPSYDADSRGEYGGTANAADWPGPFEVNSHDGVSGSVYVSGDGTISGAEVVHR